MSGNMKSLYCFLYTCAGHRGAGMIEQGGIKGQRNAGIALSMMLTGGVGSKLNQDSNLKLESNVKYE